MIVLHWLNIQLQKCGLALARYLSSPTQTTTPTVGGEQWATCLQPGDVILVEGKSRISTAIKYLTQSSWSHAALYVGTEHAGGSIIEADLVAGIQAVTPEAYAGYNVRICRPIGLTAQEKRQIGEFMVSRLGGRYDLKNIVDLARYLIPTPPIPTRFRRQLLSFGSGEPTKAICSSLIAQAFQTIRYPILPINWWSSNNRAHQEICYQIRHFSTFTPRDFDLSPYFAVVKPTLLANFDFRKIPWYDRAKHGPIDKIVAGTGPT